MFIVCILSCSTAVKYVHKELKWQCSRLQENRSTPR
jgi:hypothetical protein